MLGRREVMRTKMMIGNPVYECLPTARSCARSGECHVMSWSSALLHRIFSNLLHRSPAFPWHSRDIPACSRPFPCVLWLFPSVPPLSVVFWFVPSSVPSVFFRLFPPISLFRLVSFQFSILGSDRSESGSLLSIRLHFCSATIPFPIDLRVYCPLILWPSNYDPFLIVLFCI